MYYDYDPLICEVQVVLYNWKCMKLIIIVIKENLDRVNSEMKFPCKEVFYLKKYSVMWKNLKYTRLQEWTPLFKIKNKKINFHFFFLRISLWKSLQMCHVDVISFKSMGNEKKKLFNWVSVRFQDIFQKHFLVFTARLILYDRSKSSKVILNL